MKMLLCCVVYSMLLLQMVYAEVVQVTLGSGLSDTDATFLVNDIEYSQGSTVSLTVGNSYNFSLNSNSLGVHYWIENGTQILNDRNHDVVVYSSLAAINVVTTPLKRFLVGKIGQGSVRINEGRLFQDLNRDDSPASCDESVSFIADGYEEMVNRYRGRWAQAVPADGYTFIGWGQKDPLHGGGTIPSEWDGAHIGSGIAFREFAGTNYAYSSYHHTNSVEECTFFEVEDPVIFFAIFVPTEATHTVSITSLNDEADYILNEVEYDNEVLSTVLAQGSWIALEAKAKLGYEFVRWQVTDTELYYSRFENDDITQAKTKIKLLGDVELEAVYQAVETVALNVATVAENALVSVQLDGGEWQENTFSQMINEGSSHSIEARVEEGSELFFAYWEKSNGSKSFNNPMIFSLMENETYTAHFTEKSEVAIYGSNGPGEYRLYDISESSNPPNYSPHGVSGLMVEERRLYVSAKEDPLYLFEKWEILSGEEHLVFKSYGGATKISTTIEVTGPVEMAAKYLSPVYVDASSDLYGPYFKVEQLGGESQEYQWNGTYARIRRNSTTYAYVIPPSGYKVTGWSGVTASGTVLSISGNPLNRLTLSNENKTVRFTARSENVTLKAHFAVDEIDNCAAVLNYVDGSTYAYGERVQQNGVVYQCKHFPSGGWCQIGGSYYTPGSGLSWQSAWDFVGSCSE